MFVTTVTAICHAQTYKYNSSPIAIAAIKPGQWAGLRTGYWLMAVSSRPLAVNGRTITVRVGDGLLQPAVGITFVIKPITRPERGAAVTILQAAVSRAN